MKPSVEKKDMEAGRIATTEPDGANEEVTRNRISCDYQIRNGLNTKLYVAEFFAENDDKGDPLKVNMPVGSVELKASWLQVTESSKAPSGALTFKFKDGKKEYWWHGLHIMVTMQSLHNPDTTFYANEPSWFWPTFEFNGNPGVAHLRQSLFTQRSPLPDDQTNEILDAGNLSSSGYGSYAPVSVPAGLLDPGYNKVDSDQEVHYLGQGYKPLDFMWPIALQVR